MVTQCNSLIACLRFRVKFGRLMGKVKDEGEMEERTREGKCNTPFLKTTYNKYIIIVINKRACHTAFQNYLNRIKTI